MEETITSGIQKVLLITHEFGRQVKGGLGRVVNGLFENISEEVILDIFLMKPSFGVISQGAYLYRKEKKGRPKCLLSGEFKKILHQAILTEKYEAVHIIVNSMLTAECLMELKMHFPLVKTIYSCHSIAKFEYEVRNNSTVNLISEEFILNKVDKIQVLNNTSLKYLAASYPSVYENKEIVIIPNGIDEDEYLGIDEQFKSEIQDQVPKDTIFIFCITRWSFGKGLEYLIDAIPEVVRQKPNVKFIIAGRKIHSWEHKVGDYVSLIDAKIDAVKDYVIPLGWLDNKGRNTAYALADICVMPSLLEYFPYSILEPMVSKTPILSARIDSVEELVKEDIECMFYAPQDSKELAEKILYLIDHPELLNELQANSYKKVKEVYNWNSITEQYLDLYFSKVCTA